jgi:gliding motility-associated-like protein
MTRLLYIAFLVPLLAISQQTVEICGDTKTFNYSVQSDIASSTEWYVNGTYYYGEDISITWSYPGTYTLIATATADGCSSTPQTYTVTVTECDPLLYFVPNTFTPNGDEHNTLWGPVFNGPYDRMDYHLSIFNRWGNLIWESRDAAARWDGTYDGRKVADGIYTWVIDFGILDTDERRLIHGHVTILR